jgi:3-deoxy-manno-octulosonate cytidylyltransferase (CMP-KDO synthetase)
MLLVNHIKLPQLKILQLKINTMFTVIIPARFSSSRLPGKPLAMIANKTMIQRVYEQAAKSAASRVIVATDDARVVLVVKAFGGEVCMTRPTHVSGTDRLQEVCSQYQLSNEDIVINVQGDEPLIPPSVINQVASNLQKNIQTAVATLSEPIVNLDDFNNPNIVKVVKDNANCALYFSRASIPYHRDFEAFDVVGQVNDETLIQRHIGIYGYRVDALNEFITWPMAALEVIECLEQLRFLANGKKIHIEQSCEAVPGGIDTPADLMRINVLFNDA